MKNSMTDLRNHLFDVIERLKDPDKDKKMDANTAQAICLAAKQLIDSANVEIKYRQHVDDGSYISEFLADREHSKLIEHKK